MIGSSGTLRGGVVTAAASLRHRLAHATEPHILFPTLAVVMLAVIWGTTLNLTRVERAAAAQAAALSSGDIAAAYEAQVLRALNEIDQTLKFVKYAYERDDGPAVLKGLAARSLLPPELVFVVTIADRRGIVVASTSPSGGGGSIGRAYLQGERETDALRIDGPSQGASSAEWTLQFSRRLTAADGSFSGIVAVTVDAAHFVSGYEVSELGEHGVLGLLGADGVFLARRSGETLSAGDRIDYAAVVSATDQPQRQAPVSASAWDGVRRYTTARALYGFPLAVIVGLSADEQMAAVLRQTRARLWRASAVSLLLLLVLALLGRMSRQLALARKRTVLEHVAHAERVEYLAYHDGLTALPNRSLFSKLLGQSISHARRYNRQLAVLFLDLDRFKQINDTLGHEAGDQLLQEVASRLRACVRESDTVARLGGDEFVALLPELNVEGCAATVARKILAAVARPYILLGEEFRVTASVGISVYPQDGLDEETLKKRADIAMYQAKEEGRNTFQFYSEALNANSLERLSLEAGLRHAVERNEFQLYYQSKRDLRSNRITGLEALLRWQHPDLGTVAPMRFIPVAEETGLIVPIGRWVLRTACLQNVAWQAQGLPRLSVAVNLTARQLSDERLLPDLATILADTGMDPGLLELEISERMLMREGEMTMRVLTGLKAMGVRIAIDDFGTGYASLSTLQRFPLDTIKIDRSLVRDIANPGDNEDVTEAIIAMGRTLSLTVVAQGVETKEQAELLRSRSCQEFQGFYLNKPVPAERISQLLRDQPAVVAGERPQGEIA